MKRLIKTVVVAGVMLIAVMGQSVSKPFSTSAFSNLSATIVSPAFPNVGQSVSQFYGCLVASAFPGDTATAYASAELQASSDGANFFAISPNVSLTATSSSGLSAPDCTTLTANGYYAYVRVALLDARVMGSSANATFSGTYSGSVGATPIAGLARAGAAADKVSTVPLTSSYVGQLESSIVEIAAPPVAPATQSIYVYDVMVQNMAASPVFLLLGPTEDSLTGLPIPHAIPIPANGVVTLALPNPIYVGGGSLYAACSVDQIFTPPTSPCNLDLEYIAVPGVTAQQNLTGTVTTTLSSSSVIPH